MGPAPRGAPLSRAPRCSRAPIARCCAVLASVGPLCGDPGKVRSQVVRRRLRRRRPERRVHGDDRRRRSRRVEFPLARPPRRVGHGRTEATRAPQLRRRRCGRPTRSIPSQCVELSRFADPSRRPHHRSRLRGRRTRQRRRPGVRCWVWTLDGCNVCGNGREVLTRRTQPSASLHGDYRSVELMMSRPTECIGPRSIRLNVSAPHTTHSAIASSRPDQRRAHRPHRRREGRRASAPRTDARERTLRRAFGVGSWATPVALPRRVATPRRGPRGP
jgi:hypothetical protein